MDSCSNALDDKKYNLLSSIGDHDLNKEELHKVFQVYFDLAESKDWWNLELKPCKMKKKLFITGHETQHSPQSIVMPMDSNATMSMQELETLKSTVKEQFNSDSILLAIMSADSSIVYYKLTQGLLLPESPEQLEEKKQKRIRYQSRRTQRHMKFSNIASALMVKSEMKTSLQEQPHGKSGSSTVTDSKQHIQTGSLFEPEFSPETQTTKTESTMDTTVKESSETISSTHIPMHCESNVEESNTHNNNPPTKSDESVNEVLASGNQTFQGKAECQAEGFQENQGQSSNTNQTSCSDKGQSHCYNDSHVAEAEGYQDNELGEGQADDGSQYRVTERTEEWLSNLAPEDFDESEAYDEYEDEL